jgi:[acyl-carrier-protein] S-malonyltransferase/polyketide biosynthesis malonyl-CoA-[acyl-carrier-protein] transacylase
VGVSDFVELSDSKVLTALIDKIAAVEEPAPDPRRELIDRIKREILQPEIGDDALSFDDDQSFRRLGLNSIIYVRLARKIQTVLGIPIKPDVIFQHRSCAALADHLLSRDESQDTKEPGRPAPWREYRDERVLALLRDCGDGLLGIEQAVEQLRAGLANATSSKVNQGT